MMSRALSNRMTRPPKPTIQRGSYPKGNTGNTRPCFAIPTTGQDESLQKLFGSVVKTASETRAKDEGGFRSRLEDANLHVRRFAGQATSLLLRTGTGKGLHNTCQT